MGTTHSSPAGAAAAQPSPVAIFRTMNAFQQTAALQAALDLDLFSAVGEGLRLPAELAKRSGAAERGVRILCDYLTILGLLAKEDAGYRLTTDAAMFLDRSSPAYLGGTIQFLTSPAIRAGFDQLTSAVRQGGTAVSQQGMVEPENPAWVEFAETMAPLMRMPAEWIAGLVAAQAAPARPLRVLDIAAGHGLFGLAIARAVPRAEITAVDWPNVLEVARRNAREAGVEARYNTQPGNAFTVEYDAGYDVALLTNFLHHFDRAACTALLSKVRTALRPGGRAIALEFVPNEDRVSPPMAAGFALTMLAGTPSGDAYTFEEYRHMFREAGFSRCELETHPVIPEQLIVAQA
jgi:SAM-dependent methyltransferase